jgi:hypothetical protein
MREKQWRNFARHCLLTHKTKPRHKQEKTKKNSNRIVVGNKGGKTKFEGETLDTFNAATAQHMLHMPHRWSPAKG